MDSRLYNKEIDCPVCLRKFNITLVKSKISKVLERDSDFLTRYDGINPFFYEAYICESCGYAALADKFSQIMDSEIRIIKNQLTPKWTKRSFDGERNFESALQAFKLVLYNATLRNLKSVEMAKICIRIAWIYRLKKDEKELIFLSNAANYYIEAYYNERFPIDKLDEVTCMYMVAELLRRIGNLDESIQWFGRLISSPEAKKNSSILEKARDQIYLAKSQHNKEIDEVQEIDA
jgi:uncharacterized protein